MTNLRIVATAAITFTTIIAVFVLAISPVKETQKFEVKCPKYTMTVTVSTDKDAFKRVNDFVYPCTASKVE